MGANGLAPTNLADLEPGAGSCIDAMVATVWLVYYCMVLMWLALLVVCWLLFVVCVVSRWREIGRGRQADDRQASGK